jgi:hypothetical protein
MACVYQHIRFDTKTVFYIGIGKTISRAYSKSSRNKYWKNIVNKCENKYLVKILHDNISWEEACTKEKEYIKKYGRLDLKTGTLCNLTDGGEGICNLKHSQKTKLKISKITKERYKTKPNSRKGQIFENKNSKKVVILNLNTYIVYKFNSFVQAAVFLKTTSGRIRNACIAGKTINNNYLKLGTDFSNSEIYIIKNTSLYELSKNNVNVFKDYSKIRKKVINTETHEIFNSMTEVSRKYKIPFATLSRQLRGISKNKTFFKLI